MRYISRTWFASQIVRKAFRIMLAIIIMVGSGSFAYADEQLASDRVLQLENTRNDTRNSALQLHGENGRQLMVALFDEFSNNRSARTWLAVEKFHEYVDASLRTEFNYFCYLAMEREPMVYYLRYLNGDDNVLVLMESAMSYDFRNPVTRGDDDRATVRAVYETAMKQMQAHELTCRSKAERRLEYFRAYNSRLRKWDAMYANH